MQRVHFDQTFEGGAFHPSLNKGRSSGAVTVSPSGVRFASEQSSMELPFDGLIAELGGDNDGLVFFRHASFPEWAIYTSDHRILEHPSIASSRELQSQLGKIKGRKRGMLAALAIFFAIPILLIVLLFAGRDKMVEKVAENIPASWEQKLGETVFDQLKANKRVIDDAELNKQLETITAPLLKAVGTPRYQFKFHIIEDREMNAFALPGGTVAIHTGLLLQADTPEEVAGVLAHEIAHVTRQHSLRSLIKSVGLYAIVQALIGDATGLLAVLADNAPFLLKQKFSRDFEREADEQGWNYLLAANINPEGMTSFFKKIKAEHEKRGSGMPEALDFLSTHPATDERIRTMEEKQKKLGKTGGFRELEINFKEFQNSVRSHLGEKIPATKKAE